MTLLLTLNIFHAFFLCCYCSLWTVKCFLRSFFLYKYNYPKYKNKKILYLTSKDKKILDLTSFKIVADFLNNLNFLDISLQVNSQFIFPAKRVLFLQPSCRNWWYCKLGTMKFFRFSLTFFRQLVLQEGIFRTIYNFEQLLLWFIVF